MELLEQGRGILLARAIEVRANNEVLREHAPELANRLAQLQDALDQQPSGRTTKDPFWDVLPHPHTHENRATLARERDELLDRIRSLPGFADFLRPPRFADLRTAADAGPVVLINPSQFGSDALILTDSGLRTITLPAVTQEAVQHHVVAFVSGSQALQDGPIAQTLVWLWDAIAEPVLTELGLRHPTPQGEDLPRIWWCPTNTLALLPLHAAGHYAAKAVSVLDRVVSSYTPTLQALIHTRRRAAATASQEARPLLVAMPSTPGWPELPGARLEAERFLRRFPDAELLTGSAATRAAVIDAIGRHPWAHFACHGAQDIGEPSRGALICYDGPLTLREIVGLRLDPGELTFLSACQTSQGGLALANEAITFAATLHVACYRHVIGTLWSINDDSATTIADAVYETLAYGHSHRIDITSVATALHTAVRTLRDQCPRQPTYWAPYVYIGP